MEYNGELGNGLKVKIHSHFDGLHWVYTNRLGETLSVICHMGSYGKEKGKFEIQHWEERKNDYEDGIIGWLSFGEVQEWIDKLAERGK